MQVSVDFQDERVELDVPEQALVGAWQGPRGAGADGVPALIAEALEHPREYPPLRQAVVPGDRVVIALGDDVPEAPAILDAVYKTVEGSGVEPDGVVVLTPSPARPELIAAVPRGVTFQTHDPDDRKNLAYLAATTAERRVYLNRALTDADFVLPIGRLGYGSALGYDGPWGVVYPGSSDRETMAAYEAGVANALAESAEVSWLLGSQFQIGVIAGVSGVVGVVAGLGSAVLEQGGREVDRAWTFRAESRAELVIAGIGRPGLPTGIDDVARGLETALTLVQRGGKVVLLSKAEGPFAPAVQRLMGLDDPRAGEKALRGHESDEGYATARRLVRGLEWADVYLYSALNADDVEELSIMPLDRPGDAARLAKVSGSCLVFSPADLARAVVADESE